MYLFASVPRNSIVHSTDHSLAAFWSCLADNEVHPLAVYAHRKQEALISVPSTAVASSLVHQLKAKLGGKKADVFALPYDRLGSGTCVLNTRPHYSTQLFNLVGWKEDEVCCELADLFSSMVPSEGEMSHGPVIQSIYISPIESKLEKRYQVRLEIRLDGEHAMDEEEIARRLRAQTSKYQALRHQVWFGSLQTETKKTFLFYARNDFTGTGLQDLLMVDPDGIQDAFEAGSAYLKHHTELVRLSTAIRRFGYEQQLFIDGTELDDDRKTAIRKPEEPQDDTHARVLSLQSVLDSLEKHTDLGNVIIVHLDTSGFDTDSAMRVPLRLDGSGSGIKRSYDAAKGNYHRIVNLKHLSQDIFYLIGHKSEDVADVFAELDRDSFSPSNLHSSTSTMPAPSSQHRSSPSKTVPGNFTYPYSDTPLSEDTFKLIHTSTNSLDFHAQFLAEVFSTLAAHNCKIAKVDGMRLIQGLDLAILVENMDTDFVAHALPHGEVIWPSHHIVNYPTYVFTVVGARITSLAQQTLVSACSPYAYDFRRVRQLSIASSSRIDYCPSDMALSSEVSRRNATEDEVAQMNEVDCIELLITMLPDAVKDAEAEAQLRETVREIGLAHGIDMSVQRDSWTRRNKRVATFDMDSTLIQLECIDEMAQICGVGDRVRKITHRAMNGELDFAGALRERVALLAGAKADELFAQVIHQIWYTPHAKFLCHTLRALGYDLAVLSGGFFPIISTVKKHLKLQDAHANRLAIDPATGKLTGHLLPNAPIIDGDAKERYLRKICTEAYTDLDLSVAVGDGANDLKMLSASGLGVAFLAKSTVQQQTKFHINQLSLAPVLFLLGLHRDDCLTLLDESRH